MTLFRGSGVAIVTPFKDNKVNYNKLEELINWHIQNKTDSIVVCGTTGEAPTMSDDEKKQVFKFAVDIVNKRVPVIAGTGSNNTHHAIELSKYAESIGANGLLVVTPYYNKTTQKGLIEHYKAINDAVNIPIIVYNVPGRTGLNVLPKTLVELAKLKNIKAVKEASGNISQVADIARLCPNLDLYSGNDDMIVPLLSVGGIGVISVVANILPEDTHNIVEYYLNGYNEKARKLQLAMNGLIHSLFIETNPIPIKTAMNLMHMEAGELRLPLTKMSEENKKILIEEMKNYGIKF